MPPRASCLLFLAAAAVYTELIDAEHYSVCVSFAFVG